MAYYRELFKMPYYRELFSRFVTRTEKSLFLESYVHRSKV